MNDRFKFRAYWHNDVFNKWMVYENPELITGDGTCQVFDNGESGADEWRENVILCQCTGLKDKNGKLIYEGDVVRFEETYECACFTNIKEVLFKIVWSDYSFKAKQIKIIQGNKSYEFPLTLSKLLEIEPYTEHQTTINLEVIGNIYENPELLEE